MTWPVVAELTLDIGRDAHIWQCLFCTPVRKYDYRGYQGNKGPMARAQGRPNKGPMGPGTGPMGPGSLQPKARQYGLSQTPNIHLDRDKA